jgi:hypothetical protein
MTDFTPIPSLVGGVLIGTAAVLLMTFHGRIAGLTGILTGLLPPSIAHDWAWRLSFLVGMIAAPIPYWLATGSAPEFHSSASPALILSGGIVVGIGVTFGSGCTSGHGVCGLARFSRRSLAAVITFMASSALMVFVARHVVGG